MEDNQIKPVVVEKSTNTIRILLVIVALLLLVIGVFAGYFLFQYGNKNVDDKPVVIDTPVVEEPVVDEPVIDDEGEDIFVSGDVKWQDPEKLDNFSFFQEEYDPKYFLVGTFVDGKYNGADLILAFRESYDGYENRYYLIDDHSGVVTVVGNNEPYYGEKLEKQYHYNNKYDLKIDLFKFLAVELKISEYFSVDQESHGDVSWQEPWGLNSISGYVVGKFVSGKYQGSYLVLFMFQGMGEYKGPYLVINADNLKTDIYDACVVLTKNVADSDLQSFVKPTDQISCTIDSQYDLGVAPDLEKFTESSNGQTFVKAGEFFGPTFFFQRANNTVLKKLFTNKILGDVYVDDLEKLGSIADARRKDQKDSQYDVPGYFEYIKSGTHGFYVKRWDGTIGSYSLKIPFMKMVVDENDASPRSQYIPFVYWNDGTENKDEYAYYDRAGCGDYNTASVMDTQKIDIKNDLKVIGKTEQGDKIYGFADNNHPFLKSYYEDGYFSYEDEVKMSYDDFVNSRPFFFWQDVFGRLIKFQQIYYVSPAECGKPVIYLYPEKTIEVSVKVAPVGGFSYTDPEYNDGWLVKAEPNGQLTEIPSGKPYPYLFWEGRGGLYQTPKKGWVVEKAEVENFLYKKLAELGLNKQESADFMEFWYPKMQSAPYYFITFMGNNVMDALAPLSIEPKADTTIRILMDYVELQAPIEVEPLNIRTPERRGFTVVEWGGVLR